jgi:UDP-N-acetylmuramate--alanine ligase
MIRTAEEIGRGLAPARRARAIQPGEKIHVIGAAGAGASAAVLLAHHAGAAVSGCDPGGSSPYTRAAEKLGIPLVWQHDPAHVAKDGRALVDRVAVTKALTAVDPDHAELRAARDAGVPLEPWHQVVADAAENQGGRLVAVAGTHGKSTTSGWLVYVLTVAGRDPAAFVGALLRGEANTSIPATARWGKGDVFVVEADEYAGNFDAFRPSIALLLNAEWDHPDVFEHEDAVLNAFERWIRAAGEGGRRTILIANAGNNGVAKLLRQLAGDWGGEVVSYAAVPKGSREVPVDVDVVGTIDRNDSQLLVEFTRGRRRVLPARVALPGRHNAENAVAVAATAAVLGIRDGSIVQGLERFRGVGRRFELKGEPAGVAVIDDYGHHPSAIAATLTAARERYPGRRVWAVYEPLTFHRTAAMLDAFADVLATADQVAIADIWAGRDPDTTVVSAADLANAINTRNGAKAKAPGSVEATAEYLAAKVKKGDVVLVMGGGRSYVIAERLVELLASR